MRAAAIKILSALFDFYGKKLKIYKEDINLSKQLRTRIILGVVALVLAAAIVAGNIVLSKFSYIINQFFAGDTTDYGGAGAELEEGDELVQKLGEESMVLLKNENDFLPLDKSVKVNLFGWAATDQGFLLVGGGSGGTVIAAENKVTLTSAFKKEGLEYNEDLLKAYSAVSSADADVNSNSPDSIAALANPDASFYTSERMNKAKQYSDTAIVVLSRFSGENASQTELIDIGSYTNGTFLELAANEKAMFDALEANDFNVVVLFNTTNNMEMGFLEDYGCIKAALYAGLPGQSGALAIPRILCGEVNPSGRTADTLAYDYQTNNPSYVNGRYVNSSMVYQEGIYVGYKWYETADEEGFFGNVTNNYGTGYDAVVQYPFGYGLSYTDFEWEAEPSWSSEDDMSAEEEYTAEVTVYNKGGVAGQDVVQLYYTPPYTEGGIEMAYVNLLAFAKTDIIQPGGSDTVTLTFSAYDLASYDYDDANKNGFSGYEVVDGDYEIKLMNNSHAPATMAENGESSYILYSPGLKFANDPDTNAEVGNLFSGDTAYAGTPIDGSTVIAGGVDYLSRADNFANYPKTAAGSPNSTVNQTGTYEYDGYDNADVSDIQYGVDSGLYLVVVENEDGSTQRATLAQLEGTDSGNATLVINKELMETLSDYEAEEWDAVLDQLSEQEIKDLIGRGGFKNVAVYSVGKPLCTDRDGPAGFNMGVTNPNTETKWTGFPTESLIGCCWNADLAFSMGVAQGKVASATGLQGWYAPGVNLHRSVYNTRNYEYFSEDSVLTGRLAAAMVKGAKENNLYCYVKHFAVSEAGANPNDKNTWLTEQTLRETYLKPFEMCVKDGGANGMMSAFNRVGAVWAGSNHALLTDLLRGEWGFRGTVITDWYQPNYMDYTRGLKAGNNLWLDGTFDRAADINLSDAGTAYSARQAVKNILYTYVVTTTAVSVTAIPQSALFTALWVLLDVALAVGLGVCIFFIVKPSVKKNG